jgi:hypothetical protein
MRFIVSTRNAEGKSSVRRFEMDAEGYTEAATFAVKKLNRRKRICAVRITGDPGKHGWYQGYVSDPTNRYGLVAYGDSFHLMTVPGAEGKP